MVHLMYKEVTVLRAPSQADPYQSSEIPRRRRGGYISSSLYRGGSGIRFRLTEYFMTTDVPCGNGMAAIFGEMLTFSQEKGPEIRLRVFGDEFYARYETEKGYTAVYDEALGLYVYARLEEGRFIPSGIPVTRSPPAGLKPHLVEADLVRQEKASRRFSKRG
jgi:hypothetical protein